MLHTDCPAITGLDQSECVLSICHLIDAYVSLAVHAQHSLGKISSAAVADLAFSQAVLFSAATT